jgi:hypothetical protein
MTANGLDTDWFKSSYSNGGGDQCVECRIMPGEGMHVRDSKLPDGPHLRFTADQWRALVLGVRNSEYDVWSENR